MGFILDTYRYFRVRRAVCWLSMAALFAVMGVLASRVHLEEDISSLMPSARADDGTTKLAFANLKIKDKTFLLFENTGGLSAEQLCDVCDAFIDSLTTDTTLTADVLCRLPDDFVPDVADYLSAHLPAFLDTALYSHVDAMLTPAAMTRQMAQNRAYLESPLGHVLPELVERDPIGLRRLLLGQWQTLAGGGAGSYRLVDGHFFVPDTSVCLAFLTPRHAATNTGDGAALFRQIDSWAERFAAVHPEVRVSYHGTPAHGYDNARQIKLDLATTVGISLLLVLLVVVACFRRLDSVVLLTLPVAFGILTGLAAMSIIRGRFSLLALGIGAVVLGVAFSYVLHVMVHHRYVADPEQVLRDETRPVCLGCLTTIGSFCSLMFVKTDLLRDFGLFATFAILGTCFFTLVYLPQMLPARRRPRPFRWSECIDAASLDRSRPVMAVVLALTAAGVGLCVAGGGASFDSDMHNLGYVSPQVAHSEQLLRDKTTTGEKQRYFASTGRTMEEAIEGFALLDRKLDSLSGLGLVSRYTKTDLVLTPLSVQRRRIDAWLSFWTAERTARARNLVARTAPRTGLRPEAFEPFFDMAATGCQPDRVYLSDVIPATLLSTLVEQTHDGRFLCFTSVSCADDSVRSSDSDYHRVCDAIAAEPGLLVLDTYYYTRDTLSQMHADFDLLQWLSMLFVLTVLLFSFGFDVRMALLAFMPILLSWCMVLGAMHVFGVRFNLISIVVSTFVFGIGVDYSIFVMAGLRSRSRRRLLASHKSAVLLSAAILMLSVGSMLAATHPAISSVGFTTLVGLASAVVLSYIVQPAVYRLLKKHHRT